MVKETGKPLIKFFDSDHHATPPPQMINGRPPMKRMSSHLSPCCSVSRNAFLTLSLTLRADNTVVRGFGMGDRCSFFHMALIGLILRKVFLSIIPINANRKNEHLSPIPKLLTTVLSAHSVKKIYGLFNFTDPLPIVSLFCCPHTFFRGSTPPPQTLKKNPLEYPKKQSPTGIRARHPLLMVLIN